MKEEVVVKEVIKHYLVSNPKFDLVDDNNVKDILEEVHKFDRFYKFVYFVDCKSLTNRLANTLLKDNGYVPTIKYGRVSVNGGKSQYHSWLELNDEIIDMEMYMYILGEERLFKKAAPDELEVVYQEICFQEWKGLSVADAIFKFYYKIYKFFNLKRFLPKKYKPIRVYL